MTGSAKRIPLTNLGKYLCVRYLLFMSEFTLHPKATPQHRLGGFALDLALLFCTCYIGWIIWSLVIWGQGQTPGKQILKMKVVSSNTGRTATWGHMAIRQFLIPLAVGIPLGILSYMVAPGFLTHPMDAWQYGIIGGNVSYLFVNFLSWGVQLLDALWIFQKGENRRITDLIAKTDVLNTSVTLSTPN